MNIEALERLVELIKKPEPLMMAIWETEPANVDEHDDELGKRSLQPGVQVNSCGFAACAIGHAMVDAWFNYQGFSSEENSPKFDCLFGMDAVQEFFDINNNQALAMFSGEAYVNHTWEGKQVSDWAVPSAMVVERIRSVIESHKEI